MPCTGPIWKKVKQETLVAWIELELNPVSCGDIMCVREGVAGVLRLARDQMTRSLLRCTSRIPLHSMTGYGAVIRQDPEPSGVHDVR